MRVLEQDFLSKKDKEDVTAHISSYSSNSKRRPSIQLYSGKPFYFDKFKEEYIDITDIAHSLSLIVRFNGHCNWLHSVALHSWYMSHLVSPENALCALLHDATEAYMGDVVTPLKNLLPEFSKMENELWEVIASKYQLPVDMPNEVKNQDKKIVFSEKRDVLNRNLGVDWGQEVQPHKNLFIEEIPWQVVKRMFLTRFNELCPLNSLIDVSQACRSDYRGISSFIKLLHFIKYKFKGVI